MEALLRSQNGGVVTFGSSVSTGWEPDDIFERGIFDALFDNDQKHVSVATTEGKIAVYNFYNEMNHIVKAYFEAYNILGDPSLEMNNFFEGVIQEQIVCWHDTYSWNTIKIGPEVTFTEYSNITLKAHEEIEFSPETVIETGAEFSASIE